MNDFTKEELEQLKYHLFGNPEVDTKLCQKIQSMIDNYCDHAERVSSSDENGHMLVMCGRCDMVLWHEKD